MHHHHSPAQSIQLTQLSISLSLPAADCFLLFWSLQPLKPLVPISPLQPNSPVSPPTAWGRTTEYPAMSPKLSASKRPQLKHQENIPAVQDTFLESCTYLSRLDREAMWDTLHCVPKGRHPHYGVVFQACVTMQV